MAALNVQAVSDGPFVEKQRIKVTYVNEDERKDKKNRLIIRSVTSFKQSDIYVGSYPSMHLYTDLPEHWKYLENCMPLQLCLFREKVELIIAEKYTNIAIAYNPFFTKQPVVIFREYWEHFKSLKAGDVFLAELHKMYVRVNKPTIIFTDLHAIECYKYAFSSCPMHEYDSTSNKNGHAKIVKFTFEVKQIVKINKYRVMYADFGAIIIPKKVCKIFSKPFSNGIIIGTLKYSFTCISAYQCACWKLGGDFDYYRNIILFARSVRGVLEVIPKEKKHTRMVINTGGKIIRMVEPFVLPKEPCPEFSLRWDYMKIRDGCVKFAPEKKRTVFVRKF